MSTRYDKTLADYLVIAVSPALDHDAHRQPRVLPLAGVYQGNFDGRLHYILTLFIFAAVLIGRISIEEGIERAALFACAGWPCSLCWRSTASSRSMGCWHRSVSSSTAA